MQAAEIRDVVERAGRLLTERFVFPDVGARLAMLLGERLATVVTTRRVPPRRSAFWSPKTCIEIPATADDPIEAELIRMVDTTGWGRRGASCWPSPSVTWS